MKKRIASLTALALSVSMFVCSCGADNTEVLHEQVEQTEITLSWWGNDTRNEYTLEAVARFEKAHPEIKVKCSYSEWSGYEARNQIRMVSGTQTDVMQINVGWLSQFSADGGGYYDIEQLSEWVDLSNFSEEVLEYGRRNGVLNAIPIAMNAETVYINKTIYDRYGLDLPTKWEQLFEAAKVMHPDGIYPLSGANKSIWLYCIAYAEQQTGRQFFNENSDICFTEADLKLMIDFYNRLVKENVIPKVEDYQKMNLESGSYAGTVAWVSDAMGYFTNVIADGNEVIAAPYTVSDGIESGVGWYAKPATLYAVSKNTDHPKEAAMLLDFMLNSHEWAELQGVEKGIPISTSARDYLGTVGLLDGIQYEASLVMETNEHIAHMDPLIENADLYNGFIDACNLVLFDKSSSEEAAKELYELYAQTYTFADEDNG